MIKNIFVIVFLICGCCVYAQQIDCIVKLPAIAGSYSGECKKGMAHGKGIAQGMDRYEGEFRKGLPEGAGVYNWANGTYYEGEWKKGMREGQGKMVSGDSITKGLWKANKYLGQIPGPPYRIMLSRNVQRLTIKKSLEKINGVKIKLMLGGMDNTEIENLSLAYSSGSEYRNVGIYGIQNSLVPLDVTIRFLTWNQLHTVQYEVLFEFTILDQGVWDVTIFNM